MNGLSQDIRYTARQLRKSPGFTITAIVTLALGIGANAVVFSVMNAFLLHPMHLPRAQSLYLIERGSDRSASQSYPDYLDLRDRNRSFESLAAYNITAAGLNTGDSQSRSWLYEVSGNYFDALGIQPYLGRFFHSSDEHGANSAPSIVLTYAFWHSRFQDDRNVVGRVVELNKHPFTILGVAPPKFNGTFLAFHPDFFVPMVNQEQVEGANQLNARGNRWIFEVLGHLKTGVTPAQAAADLNAIGNDLEKSYPKDDDKMIFTLAHTRWHGDEMEPATKAFLAGLMLLAGLILLAACANLGSLFAARAADRSREVALRISLGASRGRVLRQLFTEALMISLLGGAVGLWASVLLLRGLSQWQPFALYPVSVPVNPDTNVYGAGLLLTIASGFLFGAVPMRQILRISPYEVVKAGSAARVGRRITARDLLLAGQVAICAVLVTSSLVAVRGLIRSMHSSFGFEARNAIVAETDLNMGGYHGDAVPAMQKRMMEALKAIPGVGAVGMVDNPPLIATTNDSTIFTDNTTDLAPKNAAADAQMYNISPGYFRAAGTTLLSGREVSWHDDKGALRVAVVNQEFARKLFGSASSALGGYFKMPDGTRIQIVGIAEQGKYGSITEDPQPAMFLPILQSPSTEMSLVVRSNLSPGQLGPAIRSKLRSLDPSLPFNIETWNQEMDGPLFADRIATEALGVMGLIGAVLAITGIFGMAAYSVSKRKRELGIRMALGAQRKEVLRAALGRAVRLLTFGSAAGLLLGILASRAMAVIVYQATPRDPLVLAGAVLAMSLLGLLATWIPAQRALAIDPVILLREE